MIFELLTEMFMRSFIGKMILHIGAGLRYGLLKFLHIKPKFFRPGQRTSYKRIRYGSDDFRPIDHADNNLANGFIGFLVLAALMALVLNFLS